MYQLGVHSFSVFFVFIHVKAQSASDERYSHSQDVVANFEPSLAVVIGILAIMFTLTFILLVYAKSCHRAQLVHNNMQNQDGLAQSSSRFSGIDKTVIESLPFFRFSSLKGSKEGLECAVCLSSFEDIEVLRLLPKCKHAFHIGCVDQWLETHSSCPLCRHRVSTDDVAFFACSSSLRCLRDQSEVREDSNLELFVEREENHHGSSRFGIGGSFKKSEMGKKEEELPIQEVSDDNQTKLHKLNHKITVSDVVLKNRWSSVSSSDLMLLNSEMLNATSCSRFSLLNSNLRQSPTARGFGGGHMMRIKQEMEMKRLFGSKVSKINQMDSFSALPNASDFKLNLGHASRIMNSDEQRSMSEITIHPRFRDFGMKDCTHGSSLSEISYVKDDRVRRLANNCTKNSSMVC